MKAKLEKKEFCVWAHFDEASCLALNAIKKKANDRLLGPNFEVHLTLLGQMEFINEKTEEVLSRISNSSPPFAVATDYIETKNKFFQALFIKIKNGKQLIELRNQIEKGLNLEPNWFFPHVSLYYGLETKTNKNKVKEELPQIPKELIIERITLVDTTKDIEFWNIKKSYPLKQKNLNIENKNQINY